MWRGLEPDPGRTYTGTKLETADTAKGSLTVPRQPSTYPDLPREHGPNPTRVLTGPPPLPRGGATGAQTAERTSAPGTREDRAPLIATPHPR